jgi:hypothetical protein
VWTYRVTPKERGFAYPVTCTGGLGKYSHGLRETILTT